MVGKRIFLELWKKARGVNIVSCVFGVAPLMLSGAFVAGDFMSHKILKEEKKNWFVASKESCYKDSRPLIYMGKFGSNYFGFSKQDNEICVVPVGVARFKKGDIPARNTP